MYIHLTTSNLTTPVKNTIIYFSTAAMNSTKSCIPTGSQILMENAIESLSADSRKMCLRDAGLTSLHHLEYLACLTEIDLSHNALRHIHDGFLLQHVHVLDLSHNEITTCEGLGGLDGLQTLDLSYNCILAVLIFLRCLFIKYLLVSLQICIRKKLAQIMSLIYLYHIIE